MTKKEFNTRKVVVDKAMENVIPFPRQPFRDKNGVPICPRCLGAIPRNERPGEYPGAMSRIGARTIEICSECGTEEAMQEWGGGGATPVAEWPLDRGRKWVTR